MTERITSRANPLIARLRRLGRDRQFRRAEGAFVCEGPKLLEEALRWGARIQAAVFAEGAPLPELPGNVRAAAVPQDVLESAAQTRTPQGVVFACEGVPLSMPDSLSGGRWLVLDGMQDPGNLGTLWRAADAFGAEGLLLCGCCDEWNPKAVRASMGAVFRLPVYEGSVDEAAVLVRKAGLPLYAAALSPGAADAREMDLSRCAVIVGSEGRGVSARALELCDQTLRIPMRERCESLNAAVAASVLLWEGYRKGNTRCLP